MAARGTIAKAEVMKTIAEAFGDKYLGEFDKKLYVSMRENGEEVQVAITLTCPKVSIQVNGGTEEKTNMEEKEVYSSVTSNISTSERANIEELIRKLGL